jgi:hypothetical protein
MIKMYPAFLVIPLVAGCIERERERERERE